MTPALGVPAVSQGHALIVDDEPAIRSVVRRWFERRGWQVDEAPDGAGALPLLGPGRPTGGSYDLILADLRMPRVSGAELHDWIAANRPDLVENVVIATGDVHEESAAEFLDRAGCRVLEKPFTLAALAELVAAIRLPTPPEAS